MSGHSDGLRACQCSHAIEHAGADGYLGGLGADHARRQAPAAEHVQPIHQSLGERAPVITARPLPVPPTAFGDDVNRVVSPERAWRSLRPMVLRPARRDRWRGLTRGNNCVALPCVVSFITPNDINMQ